MMPVSGEQARMKPPPPRALLALSGADLAAQSAEQLSLAAVPIVAVLVLGAGPGDIGLLADRPDPIGLLAALGFVGAVGTVGFSVAAPALAIRELK